MSGALSQRLPPWLHPQWRQLQRQIAARRLPHAMLFHGMAGLGKTLLARALAHALLCETPLPSDQGDALAGQACGQCGGCKLLAAGTHPDFYRLEPTPPASSKSKQPVLAIRIDAIRQLIASLAQTSQRSGYRVAIIEQADAMNHAAANSLLKTLEEPGDDTLMLLVSAAPARLPITIRSRCQPLAFHPPAFDQARDWLQAEGGFADEAAAREAFAQSRRAPFAALALADEAEQRQLLDAAMLAAVERRDLLEYSAKLAQGERQKLLGWMLQWIDDRIYLCSLPPQQAEAHVCHQRHLPALRQLAARSQPRRLYALRDEVLQTLQQGQVALNAQLMWDNLLLSWAE